MYHDVMVVVLAFLTLVRWQVSTVVWESKTEEEKEQVFQKLLRFTVQKPKTVTSSDGKLTISKIHKSC
jgi:hypothetical protein